MTFSTPETESSECPVWIKIDFSYSSHTLLLYPRNVKSFQREFWEREPREKQDWLIHNFFHLILQIPLLSLFPLTYPWKVHFAKSLSHHTHINEEVFWCLGNSSEKTNLFGWCNEIIAGFRMLKKSRLGVTLLEQEAWRA